MKHLNQLLTDKVVGISISQSPDLKRLGFGSCHLEDAQLEIARHLLAVGAKLMYGGDLRPGGFTELLIDLVRSYSEHSEKPDEQLLINYLGWPNYTGLSKQQYAELSAWVEIIKSELPGELDGKFKAEDYLDPKTPEDYYLWSRSMTQMRQLMVEANGARICLGGKTDDFKGRYPGIAEEAYLTLQSGKPLFLIGAYGGATTDVIAAIQGNVNVRLTTIYHYSKRQVKENAEYFNSRVDSDLTINYDRLVSYFQKVGVSGLNNGLSKEDNERLFQTIHIPEMVSLILKGIVSIWHK